MSTPPTTILDWANSADPSDVTQPTSQITNSGWLGGMIPPNAYVNWIWKNLYDWLAHFKAGVAKYTDMEDAIDATPVGETFILDEYDVTDHPGDFAGGWDKGFTTDQVSVDAWGKGVLIATDQSATSGSLIAFSRNLLTTVASYTKTNTGVIKRAVTDGTYVVACYGDYVECWDMNGSQRWLYDHGAAVHDVCLDGVNAYFVGAKGTGNKWARAIALSDTGTPTPVWSYAHGNASEVVYCCCTDGNRLFMAGDASGLGSGATLRAISAADGKDANGEGGIGTDTLYQSWNAVQSNLCTQTGQLATDGKRLVVGYSTVAFKGVEVRSASFGAVIHSWTSFPSTDIVWVAIDSSFIYGLASAGGASRLHGFTKDLVESWIYRFQYSGTLYDVHAVASDCYRIFLACEPPPSPGPDSVYLSVNMHPKIWRRHASTDRFLPYRQLAIPEE